MRSKIATHSHEVRSLQRYELKSTRRGAQLRCGTGGDGRGGGAGGHCSVERETRFRQPEPEIIFSHSSLTKGSAALIEVVAPGHPLYGGPDEH